jgi:CHAT domain-containing protein
MGSGSYDLTDTNNNISTLAANTTNDIKYTDTNGFVVGTVNTTNGISAPGKNVTLTAGGAVTQTQAITANILTLTGTGTGSFDLGTQNNDVNKLTATTANQDVKFKDSNGFTVGDGTTGIAVGTGNVTLEAGGLVDQNKAITASGLELLGSGSYDLTNTNNNISTLAANTSNFIKYTDTDGFDIGTVNSTNGISAPGKNVTLTAGGAVTQTQAITANILTLTGTGTGSFDLGTQNNDVTKLTATTANQDVKFKDSNGFSVGDGTTGIAVGTGNVTLEAGGLVDQNKAITASGLELLGSGSYDLTDTNNNISTLAANTSNFIKYTDTDGFAIGTVNSTNGISAPGKNVTLTAGGAVTQTQAITANILTLTGTGTGSFDLGTQNNDVTKLTATTANQDVKFKDSNGFTVGDGTTGIAVGTGNVTLEAGGLVDQNKAITASGLELLGSGSYDLTDTNNNISTLAANTSNFIKYTDTDGFDIGTVNSTNGISAPGKNVTLTAGGAVTQTQAITANILTLTGTGTGSFDLGTQNNDVNKLTATTVNQDVKFKDSNGFSVGDGTTGIAVGTGNVTLEAGGAVTQSEAITAGGLELLGSGSYDLTDTNNNISTLAANTSNFIKYTDTDGFAIGTVNSTNGISAPGKNVTLTAGGAVTQTQAITANILTLTGTGTGSFDLGTQNNDVTKLTATTANQDVKFKDSNGFSVGDGTTGIAVGTGNVTLEAGGLVDQNKAITASGLELLGSGSYDLTNTNNNISTLAANTTNDIKYTDTNGFVVGTVNTTNGISAPGKNVTLTAGGAVTQTQAITANILTLTGTGTGSFDLGTQNNDVTKLTATTANQDVKFKDSNGFTVGDGTTGIAVGTGNVTLEAGGLVDQNKAITASGLELLGSGSYDLTDTNNNISTLAANTTNDIKYTDTNGFVVGTVNTTNGISAPGKNVTLTAGGAVTQTQAITANILTLTGTGTGSFDLGTQNNDVTKLTATTANQDVKFKDSNGFTVGDGTTGIAVGTGNVTLEAGGLVDQNKAITASGLELLGSGSYDLTDTNNNISTLAANTTNDIKYTDTNGFVVGTVNTTNGISAPGKNVTLTAGGAVTQTQAITANILTLTGTGTGSFDLGTQNNDVNKLTATTANQDVKFKDSNGFTVGDGTTGIAVGTGNVTLEAGGLVDQNKAITASGLELLGSGSYDLTNTNNNISTLAANTTNDIKYTDTNGFVVGTVNTTNGISAPGKNVTLTAGGAVTQTQAITANILTLTGTGTGSFDLGTQNNDVNKLTATTANQDVKFKDSNGFTVGDGTTGIAVGTGNVTLEAGGLVDQNKAITASGLELLGSGSYDLTNTNNNISTLAANTSNFIKYTDTDGFDIGTVNSTNGISAPGKNVTLTAGGAVTQTQAITANILTLTGTGTGSFDLGTQNNDVTKLTATTANQDVKFKDSNGFSVGDGTTGIAVGTGNVTLEAGGLVDQNKAITASGLELLGSGSYDLTDTNNNISTLAANTSNFIKYTDTDGFAIGTVNSTNGISAPGKNVTLTAGGAVTQTQAITANILTLTGTGTGSFDLGTQNNDVTKLTATTANQDVKFKDSNGFSVGDGTTGIAVGTGNVTLEAGGLVDQNKAITASGLELLGSGSYDLTDTNNNISTLAANTTNDIKYTDTNGFVVGTVNTTNGISAPGKNVTLTAGGAVTQTQAITANILTLTGTGTGSFDLGTQNNDVTKLTATTANQDVKFKDSNGFTVGDGTTGIAVGTGNVTLEAGGLVDQNKAITASGLELLGSGSYDLTDTNNNISTLAANTSNFIKYTDTDGFDIGTVNSTNGISAPGKNVTLTAGGAVTQTQAITANILTLTGTGTGSFDLGTQNNDVTKLTATTANQDVKFKDSNGFSVGDGTTGIAVGTGNVTLEAGGLVDQNKAITASGLELLGSGSYDLTNTNNNISTLAANTSNFIKYTDTDGFVVGTVGSTNGVNVGANNLTLEAISGTVTQSEAITASGLELLGSGSYTLTNTANNISTLAANTSNFIKYTDTDGFAIGTVNSTNGISAPGKNVTLTAGGAVTQSQAITASGLELKGAGDYFLINPTNDVNTLTLDNTTGIVSFVDADELSISGVGTLGAVYIVAQGNITQTLDLNTDGSVVLSSVNGNIDATGKNIFSSSGTILLSANTSVTTGDLTALNNIDIIAGTSVTTGDLTAFEDIRITAGTSVTTGDLTAFEDIRITAGTSVTTGDLTAFEDIRITADTSVTTGDLFAFGDIGIDAGTSVTTGDLTAFEDIRITAGTSVTTGDLTALNNIDIIAGTSVTTGALDAFLDILITAINGSITVNGDVGFTNLPNNVIFEAFNEITAKDIKAFKNVDLSNPSPLTTSGILTVGDVTTQIGNIFLFPLQKLEAGNLTSNGGEIFAATSSVDIPSSALDSQGRIENFDYITIFDKLNGGSVKVGNVKSGGGSIVLISPDPDNPIQAGILDSTGSGSSTFEIGSGTKAVEVFIVSNNAIKLDSITAQGTGQINIAARSGFLATDTNTSGFSIQTKGGALIDLQYALTGTFTVGTTTGIGTKGKITNGLITLSPNLTFQCFPTDCGVFNQISIRPTNPTFESAFRPPTPPQRPLPRPDLQRNEIPRLTLSEVDTRQLLDVSEVLRTQLDVATEEGIFSLDVAFGAEFANYLGVKPANTLRSAADVRKLLEDIYKQTGRKTAVVYWVLDQLYLNIVLITPGVPQGIAQKQGIVVASVDLTTGLVQQPTTAPLIYRGVPTARRDEVLRVIDRFRSQVTDRRSRDYLKDAQALYRWLIEPIEPELQAQGIDTLLVVPDKGIRLLPLGALYDGKQFLIEKYNVAMTPSVNLISTRYRPLQGAEVLAMGASTFADERSLPSVPIELKTITSIWPGRYFLNQDFTPERLVQEHKTGQFRIVHLATHATFKPGDLSESYIVFGNNQKLPVTKLPELSLKGVELFSLGACRTLIGDTTDPTVEFGFAGLAVKTGVETAVASLWNVEDTPTMALMTEFYRYLQKTPIKAEALRQAQLALMQGQTRIEIEGGQLRLVTRSGQSIPLPPELANIRDLDFSHPYFWSGFSMIGSPW